MTISGIVNLAEMLGSETLLFGVLGTESFVSRMQQPRLIEREEAMSFDVNVDRLHLFDRESEENLIAAASGQSGR